MLDIFSRHTYLLTTRSLEEITKRHKILKTEYKAIEELIENNLTSCDVNQQLNTISDDEETENKTKKPKLMKYTSPPIIMNTAAKLPWLYKFFLIFLINSYISVS